MFRKIRYAYHLTVCEKMIKNNEAFDYTTCDWSKKYKRHRDKLTKILWN